MAGEPDNRVATSSSSVTSPVRESLDGRGLPPDARCLGCGYRLRDLPTGVCPECGRAFNPGDRGTYRLGPRFAYWRRWARPPSAWLTLIGLPLVAAQIVGRSGIHYSRYPISTLSCCAVAWVPTLAGIYFVYVFACLADRRRTLEDRAPKSARSKLNWVAFPILAVMMVLTLYSDWPFRLRFALSRAALEEYARPLIGSAVDSTYRPVWRRIGLFQIERVWLRDADGDGRCDCVEFHDGPRTNAWALQYGAGGTPRRTVTAGLPSPWRLAYFDYP